MDKLVLDAAPIYFAYGDCLLRKVEVSNSGNDDDGGGGSSASTSTM